MTVEVNKITPIHHRSEGIPRARFTGLCVMRSSSRTLRRVRSLRHPQSLRSPARPLSKHRKVSKPLEINPLPSRRTILHAPATNAPQSSNLSSYALRALRDDVVPRHFAMLRPAVL